MRTRGESGLEKIDNIWYFSYINLNGKQIRRSSRSKLKQVAVEMLRKAKEELAKGIAPVDQKTLLRRLASHPRTRLLGERQGRDGRGGPRDFRQERRAQSV